MTLALSEKKSKRVSTMSGDFHANFTLESHRGNWPVVINCPDYFTSTNPVSISSRGANISSAEGSYGGHVTLGNLTREELF